MKIVFLACLALLLPVSGVREEDPYAAVTYEVSPGRFGDRLFSYLHAKWISFFYGYPLLYKPFLLSDAFALHDLEEHWTEEKQASFDCIIPHTPLGGFGAPLKGSLLYVIPFFAPLQQDRIYNEGWACFDVDWKNKRFRALLKTLFRPRKKVYPVAIPRDQEYLTVAVHVRRGGGVDIPDSFQLWPLRFPPDSYFIECLRRLSDFYPGIPIYAHVFTDELDPVAIVDKYEEELSDLPITFGCRMIGNSPDKHIVEDFLAMMQFDCLIRTESNYTFLPMILTEYAVVMTPKHVNWIWNRDQKLENYVDEIDIQIFPNGQ